MYIHNFQIILSKFSTQNFRNGVFSSLVSINLWKNCKFVYSIYNLKTGKKKELFGAMSFEFTMKYKKDYHEQINNKFGNSA